MATEMMATHPTMSSNENPTFNEAFSVAARWKTSVGISSERAPYT